MDFKKMQWLNLQSQQLIATAVAITQAGKSQSKQAIENAAKTSYDFAEDVVAKKAYATMRPDDRSALESQLLVQLADVERELIQLEARRTTLRDLLLKVRRENLRLRDVTRKNSLDRVLVESRILETLGEASRPVSTRTLHWKAKDINPRLRGTTFRSYLHRLKTKGLISNAAAHGYWILVTVVPPAKKAPSADAAQSSHLGNDIHGAGRASGR